VKGRGTAWQQQIVRVLGRFHVSSLPSYGQLQLVFFYYSFIVVLLIDILMGFLERARGTVNYGHKFRRGQFLGGLIRYFRLEHSIVMVFLGSFIFLFFFTTSTSVSLISITLFW
jgi:hypothetical protein